MKKYILGSLLVVVLALVVVLVKSTDVEATSCVKVCPNGYPNVSHSHQGYCYKNGNHIDWPEDYKAMVCSSTPTPTATPVVTPSPTPVVTPTPTPSQSPEPSETPTPSEEPKSTPTPEVRVETPLTEAGAPTCGDVAPAKVPNIFVANAGKGQLEVRWIPTGGDKALIFYGLEAGKPLYSLIDTPNDGVEVIGGLNSGSHYWFSVSNGSGCAWSSVSDWYDPIVE